MHKNYERYTSCDYRKLNVKGIGYYLYRKLPDTVLIPLIQTFKKKKVLEVGIGGGFYTGFFLGNQCLVTGVDINPHLGKHLGLKIIMTTADDFSRFFPGKPFDVVASFWMTEYLSLGELEKFFKEALAVLDERGFFMTTIIENKGLGKFYTLLSGLKKIQKFCYAERNFLSFLSPHSVTVKKLKGRFGLSFAYLVCVQKRSS